MEDKQIIIRNSKPPRCQVSCMQEEDGNGRITRKSVLINVRAESPYEAQIILREARIRLGIDPGPERDVEEQLRPKFAARNTAATPKREQKAQIAPQGVNSVEQRLECPECGGTLVQRTARNSGKSFTGCSSYPSCHYIANAEQKAPAYAGKRDDGYTYEDIPF